MAQLSMETRIELRKAGLSKLSYLLDKVLQKSDGSVEMTVAQICETTGLKRKFVENAVNIDRLRTTLPKTTRKAETEGIEHMFTFDLILGIMYSYKVKKVHMVREYESTCYHLPSSEDLDTIFKVQHPTYMRVRLNTFLLYKADITQFLTVKQPGLHSYKEIAKAAGVSESTVKRHEDVAGTRVIRHTNEGIPLSKWDLDSLPDTYADYVEHNKKYKFRGAWLECNGIREPYAKTGYQKHLMRGGTKDTIFVKWNTRGDHFARKDLVVEKAIDEHEKKMMELYSDRVYLGKMTMEAFKNRFPSMFRQSVPMTGD